MEFLKNIKQNFGNFGISFLAGSILIFTSFHCMKRIGMALSNPLQTFFLNKRTTPPRTHRINGVKSQILKPTFLA